MFDQVGRGGRDLGDEGMRTGEGGEDCEVGGGDGAEVCMEDFVRVGFGRDGGGGEGGEGGDVGSGEEGEGRDGLGGEVEGY